MVKVGDRVRVIKSLRPVGVVGGDKYVNRIGTVEFIAGDNESMRVRFDKFDKWWMSPDYFVVVIPSVKLEQIW